MKLTLMLATLVLSASAFAADVKINSFYYIANSTRLAELCGTVEGGGDRSDVRVNVDFKTNRPAVYNTTAGKDGKFCLLVNTISGLASAGTFADATPAEALAQK